MFSPGELRRRTGLRTVFQGRGAQSARTRLDGSCGAPRELAYSRDKHSFAELAAKEILETRGNAPRLLLLLLAPPAFGERRHRGLARAAHSIASSARASRVGGTSSGIRIAADQVRARCSAGFRSGV